MIRYQVTPAALRAAITAVKPSWFDDAAALAAELPDLPRSADFKPLWSRIKGVYIELQHSKCCFCEKPLEGKIEQDVEHFRPKAEVKPWKVPHRLAVEEGVDVRQPTDGSSERGYTRLAYSPFNYAMACKVCNSTLKKNYFPIEGARQLEASEPPRVNTEKPLLIYPIGSVDEDPEALIAYDALSPVPNAASGFRRRRALVTIELFGLDDSSGRRSLFKLRATLVRMLFLELEGQSHAATAQKRRKHQTAIDVLTSPQAPFASCLRSFARLYKSDRARADEIADGCLEFMKTKSKPGRST